MVAYLDSSVILRHILLGEISIKHALACPRVITSELTEIECRRVIHRYRLNGDLDDDGLLTAMGRLDSVLAGVSVVELGAAVKRRAMGAFPLVVKTLDALHLATGILYAESLAAAPESEHLLLFSHDRGMNRCAAALGFATPLRGE